LLAKEIDMSGSVVFARMAVHHEAAMSDLSKRFGAKPQDLPALLQGIRSAGAEAAMAFNVGSSVTDPEAYRYAITIAKDVLQKLPFKIRLIDVGGGYPKSYPGFTVPHLDEYFRTVSESFADLPLADNAESRQCRSPRRTRPRACRTGHVSSRRGTAAKRRSPVFE
jgi:ornithine decarboxylase